MWELLPLMDSAYFGSIFYINKEIYLMSIESSSSGAEKDPSGVKKEARDDMLRGMIGGASTPEALIAVLDALKISQDAEPALWDVGFATDRVIIVDRLKSAIEQVQKNLSEEKIEDAKNVALEYLSYEEPGSEIADKIKEFFPELKI